MRFWQLVGLALDGIRRTPLRAALTAAGVAIATGALVAMVAFAEGLQRQAEKPFQQIDVLSRIEVFAERPEPEPGASPSPSPSPASSPSPAPSPAPRPVLDDAAVAKLGSLPRVSIAYPEIQTFGVELSFGGKKKTVFVSSMPREARRLPWIKDLVAAGRFFDTGEAPQVVLSRDVAKDLGFAPAESALGKRISIRARGLVPGAPAMFSFQEKTVDAEVVGIMEFGGFRAFGASVAMLPLDVMRSLPGIRADAVIDRLERGEAAPTTGWSRIVVRTDRPSDAPEVEKAIRALGYRTRTLATEMKTLKTFFVLLDVLLGAVGTVALVVAGLGIVNTLLMAVLERYREIGAYKALGASDGDVRTVFLAEAGFVGLIGGALGIGLGRVVAWGIGLGINAYARGRGLDRALDLFHFPGWLVAGAVAFAVTASVLSGVYPASRAARVDPIRALRGE